MNKMADRIFINKKYKESIDLWSGEKNILDFKDIENIEKFTLAASFGIDNPKQIEGSREGYVRLTSIPTYSKAILSSILLGKAENGEIDKCADEEKCYEEAERCVESGFMVLKEKINEAKGDEDLLCKRLMAEIDALYETKIKSSIEGEKYMKKNL